MWYRTIGCNDLEEGEKRLEIICARRSSTLASAEKALSIRGKLSTEGRSWHRRDYFAMIGQQSKGLKEKKMRDAWRKCLLCIPIHDLMPCIGILTKIDQTQFALMINGKDEHSVQSGPWSYSHLSQCGEMILSSNQLIRKGLMKTFDRMEIGRIQILQGFHLTDEKQQSMRKKTILDENFSTCSADKGAAVGC